MIQVCQPTIDAQTKKDMLDVLDSGWWGFGPKTQEFEKEFAKKVGAKYAIGTNSGTAALDLCLKVYNISGGELITTPVTFVADAIVGEWNNMDVTFADIDERTLCIDPEAIHFTQNTKAIIAVDSHGRLANIKRIKERIDQEYDAMGMMGPRPLVIEDAAHAMYTPGAGQDADITIWSFQAVKTLPCGDGGMITTNDEAIYKKLRTLTWLGVEKSTFERLGSAKYTWDYNITQAQGLKAYMNDLTAVIGLGQLRRLDHTLEKRRKIQKFYNICFKNVPQIKIPEYSHTVQYYTMECENRDELAEFLASKGIITSVHFKPLSEMTYWKKAVKRELPVVNKTWTKWLSLPVHDALGPNDLMHIVNSVWEFYNYKETE